MEQIQQNSRLTAEELAEKVCLSPSAVQRRLRRLRENKVIEREVAIVSPESLGRGVTAIVEVTLDSDRPEALADFKRAIQNAPEIMQGYYVTGEADFILILTASSMQEYDEFVHRFLWGRGYVKHSRTSIVLRRIKTGFAMPVNVARQSTRKAL